MYYLFFGFIIGSCIGRFSVIHNYRYYESLYNLQESKINKYKKFLLDKKMEKEYTDYINT